MILPNKLISFQDCILAKTVYILEKIGNSNVSIIDLYEQVETHFEDLNESEQILRVMQRMISPVWKEQQLSLNLMFAEEIISHVPVFSFLCMPEPSSAQSLKAGINLWEDNHLT